MYGLLNKLKPKSHWDISQAIVAALLVLLVVAFTARLVWAYYNDEYTQYAEGSVKQSAKTVWLWATDNELRPLWQVGLYDAATYSGEPTDIASSRVVFLIWEGERWQSLETTLESVDQEKIRMRQTFEGGQRDFIIMIKQISSCQTEVRYEERGTVDDFWQRYFLFWTKADHQQRLERSLEELNTWIDKRQGVCAET